MIEMLLIIGYLAIAFLLLFIGDRLGAYTACVFLRRCSRRPLLSLPRWLHLPLSILIPVILLIGLLLLPLIHSSIAFYALVDNLELMLLPIFFLTGILGGFICQLRGP